MISINDVLQKPNLDKGIYRVKARIMRDGNLQNAEGDLIFLEDGPTLVLEWSFPPENLQVPALTLKLDPSFLEQDPAQELGYFRYHGELFDPRATQ